MFNSLLFIFALADATHAPVYCLVDCFAQNVVLVGVGEGRCVASGRVASHVGLVHQRIGVLVIQLG